MLYLKMRFRLIILLCFCIGYSATVVNGQSNVYEQSIVQFRESYKKEFLSDINSPLQRQDLSYLRFYKPDPAYIVKAQLNKITDSVGFDMLTHQGQTKKYYVYGQLTFTLQQKKCTLYIYQSEKLRMQKGFEDYLFIPFTDPTNIDETFGGGRYLDCRMNDIMHGYLLIDFNKCYNPYCAYKGGYACPIPPRENDLMIPIRAGEKKFGKTLRE